MATNIDFEHHFAQLQERGYTILEDVIEPELADGLVKAILDIEGKVPGEIFADVDDKRRKQYGNTLRMRNLLAIHPLFQRAPVHPNVLPLIEKLLDPELLLRAMSTLVVPPGEPAQPIHSDDR